MAHIISVHPREIGWEVTAPGIENPMAFLSGAKAEIAAKSLAERFARRGEAAELRIHLRDGTLAGRFVCAPLVELPLAG
ncbi:MAG TPA: hypothetical protein VD906_04410 [Caulobacteraceae bacterium]|nr:hypothetical protein [Caulobacteraceae bacterium]